MILTTLVVAVALGIAAQVLAERFQLPAILPLLVFGIFVGPSGLGWVVPSSLGDFFQVLVHLGVAIILFEGGLSLEVRRLVRVGNAVWSLVTVGVVVTGVGATVLAHLLVGLDWQTAALFGAILTVTGPTVIGPLMRHMIAPRHLKTAMVSEGLINDPIGAVLAYLVLQWIQRTDAPWQSLVAELAELALVGAALGFVAGSLAKTVVRRRLVAGDLTNLVVLSLVLLCYFVAEHQAEQSGILAVVVMGFTMAAAELPDVAPLKAFKGQLTTLFISFLFILLAAQLDLSAVVLLGWGGLLVVAGLIVVVRPLAVGLSVWSHSLGLRERLVLALTAPRGIVAAAVASLASRELTQSGLAGGSTLEGLVYLAIIVTGAWATAMAVALPPLLGYTRDPERGKVVLVGANTFTELLSGLLRKVGRGTVIVDYSSWRLDHARSAGHDVVYGDARQTSTYENANVERDTIVVAATTNDELNLLVAQKVHDEFGVEHPVVVLQEPPEELGRRSRAWMDLLGGRGIDLQQWLERLKSDTATVLTCDADDDTVQTRLAQIEDERPQEVVHLFSWRGSEPVFRHAGRASGTDLAPVLLAHGRALELLQAARESTAPPPPDDGEPRR